MMVQEFLSRLSEDKKEWFKTDEAAARIDLLVSGYEETADIVICTEVYEAVNPSFREQAKIFYEEFPDKSLQLKDEVHLLIEKIQISAGAGDFVSALMHQHLFLFLEPAPPIPEEKKAKMNELFMKFPITEKRMKPSVFIDEFREFAMDKV